MCGALLEQRACQYARRLACDDDDMERRDAFVSASFFVAVDAAPRLLTCMEPSSPNGPFDFLSSSPTPFLLRLLPLSLACSAVGGPRCRMLHYWMGCRSPVSAKTPSQTSRQTEGCQETSGATPGATSSSSLTRASPELLRVCHPAVRALEMDARAQLCMYKTDGTPFCIAM